MSISFCNVIFYCLSPVQKIVESFAIEKPCMLSLSWTTQYEILLLIKSSFTKNKPGDNCLSIFHFDAQSSPLFKKKVKCLVFFVWIYLNLRYCAIYAKFVCLRTKLLSICGHKLVNYHLYCPVSVSLLIPQDP